MVTDLGEILRLGTAKAEENLRFRRYLSAHHCPDGPFHILAAEIQRHIDCTACGNCCRHSVVAVTRQEIETIARHLEIEPAEAERLYTDRDPDAPAGRILRNSPEGCVFFDGRLCLIYEARPDVCRGFPHIAAGDHSLGSRPSSLARWAALCPIVYNALEAYKHCTGYHDHPHRAA